MIRHIVMWDYKEGFTAEQNAANALRVKAELESLINLIDGIKMLRVEINPLPSGNKDVALISLFESEAALASYQIHPEHVRVSAYVGTVLQNRACMDFYE